MKTIASKLYPRMAQRVATIHNRECHSGVPTALIVLDEKATMQLPLRRPPYYKVVCEECTDADV